MFLLVLIPAVSALRTLLGGHDNIFPASVGVIAGLGGLRGILHNSAGNDYESTLGVILVYRQQNGCLIYVAAMLGFVVGRCRHDRADVLFC